MTEEELVSFPLKPIKDYDFTSSCTVCKKQLAFPLFRKLHHIFGWIHIVSCPSCRVSDPKHANQILHDKCATAFSMKDVNCINCGNKLRVGTEIVEYLSILCFKSTRIGYSLDYLIDYQN
jgi:hypothetical protein